MTRFPLLILLCSIFINANGHQLDFCRAGDSNASCAAQKEFHQPDEIIWIGQLPSISLQIKTDPELKRGRTGKLYNTVRAPTKLIDRQVRKGSSYAHSLVMRGISSADKQIRSGTLFAHQLIKQGLIALDQQLTSRSKGAYDYLKRTSSLLDDKLVAGTRKTHSTVKHTIIPLDKGVVLGSAIAYGTVRRGVATVDKRIRNSVKAVDRQLSSRTTKGVSIIKSLFNRFIKPGSEKIKPTFSTGESELRASGSEPATPVPGDTEIVASDVGHKKNHHLDRDGKEEANGFNMVDHHDNNHGRDHEHQHEDSITDNGHDKQMNFDGGTRNIRNNKKKRYSQLGRFTDSTLKPMVPRGYSNILSLALPTSFSRSFSKLAKRTFANNSIRSLSEFRGPIIPFWRGVSMPKSLSKLWTPRAMTKVQV